MYRNIVAYTISQIRIDDIHNYFRHFDKQSFSVSDCMVKMTMLVSGLAEYDDNKST